MGGRDYGRTGGEEARVVARGGDRGTPSACRGWGRPVRFVGQRDGSVSPFSTPADLTKSSAFWPMSCGTGCKPRPWLSQALESASSRSPDPRRASQAQPGSPFDARDAFAGGGQGRRRGAAQARAVLSSRPSSRSERCGVPGRQLSRMRLRRHAHRQTPSRSEATGTSCSPLSRTCSKNAFKFTGPAYRGRVETPTLQTTASTSKSETTAAACHQVPSTRCSRPSPSAAPTGAGWGSDCPSPVGDVEADGGTLTVQDKPGMGCVFTMSLPRHRLLHVVEG
jgi:hypothetical protein